MKSGRIAKVLKLKGYAKELLEQEVRKGKDELNEEKMKLDSLKEVSRSVFDGFHLKYQGGPASMGELDFLHKYFSNLNRRIERQRMNVLRKVSELEAKQKEIYNAHREERLIEILHERVRSREEREALSAEQKETDYHFLSRKWRG
jgi:flagellar export protein FliJ